MSRSGKLASIALVAALVLSVVFLYQRGLIGRGNGLDFDAVEVEVVQLRPDVYLFVSVAGEVAAGNMVAQIGSDGVLLVDTQYHQLGEKLLEALRGLTDAPVEFVVNTHVHIDHLGGNEYLASNGRFGPGEESQIAVAPILAHENVLTRISGPPPQGRRREVWPTETYSGAGRELVFDGEVVEIVHPSAAHTDGDSVIHLTGSDVIVAGDIFNNRNYPFINLANGGSLRGLIDGLRAIAALSDSPDVTIVPGHGEPASLEEFRRYTEMIQTIAERIARMKSNGMSLDEVIRARPSASYDARFGNDSGFWTTGDFIEVVYLQSSLSEDPGN